MRKMDYEYGTTPRKLEPNYVPRKKNKNVALIVAIFLLLLAVSYRSSLINEKFNEIQNAKAELASIEKTNGQLEVSIESSLNLSNIEQSAKENLGMQRLDNSQKVYVTLDKRDYVEASTEDIDTTSDSSEETWYQKIMNKILGKE